MYPRRLKHRLKHSAGHRLGHSLGHRLKKLFSLTTLLPALIVSPLLVVTLTGCASIVSKPLKPTIELISVQPLNASLSEQKLRFNLKVTNPNSFNLPVEAINFVARFNNTNIANGKSNQAVTIPANGDAMLALDVTAGLNRLTSALSTLLGGDTNLEYELKGTVEVATWPRPIPFDVVGATDLTDF